MIKPLINRVNKKGLNKYLRFEDFIAHVYELLDVNANTPDSFMQRLDTMLTYLEKSLTQGIAYSNFTQGLKRNAIVNMRKQGEFHRNAKLVKDIINYYLNGQIQSCLKVIDDWFEYCCQHKGSFHGFLLLDTNKYYKIRVSEEKPITSAEAMLHVPYEKRHLANVGRYSVLGFPCVYLSKSIACCWEELNHPVLNKTYVSAFQPKEMLYFLFDLRLNRISFGSEYELIKYLEYLPIITACSFKVKYQEASFKPEYVIPQMILTSLIAERKLNVAYGIAFSSSKMRTIRENQADDMCCVIPAFSPSESGTSEIIKKMFKVTIPKCVGEEIQKHQQWTIQDEGKLTRDSHIWKVLEEQLWDEEEFEIFA